LITLEKEILLRIRFESPTLLESLAQINIDNSLIDALNFIIKTYNDSKEKNLDLISEFEKIRILKENSKYQFTSCFLEIGKKLVNGNPPSIKDIINASYSYK
jgi:hypothetical protein